MEVGLFAIGIGRTADPDVIAHIARKADDIGFASLWAPEDMVLFDESVGVSDQLQPVTLDALKRYRDAGVRQTVGCLPTTDPARRDAALEEMGNQLVVPGHDL
jgi:alkanesulfonate monooxygenase SsuD/methylene tetrahydromethanopterin reductase-like flavin-dependent oxidoreductase (luciferase family)